MMKGSTVLIQKDKSKENEASNLLPHYMALLTWKLLTGVIADEIYGFLEDKRILS